MDLNLEKMTPEELDRDARVQQEFLERLRWTICWFEKLYRPTSDAKDSQYWTGPYGKNPYIPLALRK
jgi:hypothetical protein